VLQQILVEEGSREVEERHGSASVSKISVVTGLNRAQTSKLLAGESATTSSSDLLLRVIGQWSQNTKYRDEQGVPRVLQFQGLSSEFADLVGSITREVNHYPILFELERVGAVEITEDTVRLLVDEFIPVGDVTQGLALLGADVGELIATVESNLTERREHPHLHLKTVYDNIPPERVEELRLWILRKGVEFHHDIRQHLSKFDRDLSVDVDTESAAAQPRAMVSVSSFSYASEIKEPKKIMPRKRGRKRGKK
jgi:hypothetical protein